MPLSGSGIATVKGMLLRCDKQQDIAAWFGVNQARINDIAQGYVGART
jgi:predicted XRE-type DNA-binding protein